LKPPSPDSADVIATEFEVSQRWVLLKHSCKTRCPGIADLIAAEIEVSQRWTLRKHSYKALCPSIADPIAAEIEMIQRCALPQHSCKVLEFSVGAFLSRMCFPCALTLNSMFAEYAFAFPHSRKRWLAKTSKISRLNTCDRFFLAPRR
jgi:hypothetical protein